MRTTSKLSPVAANCTPSDAFAAYGVSVTVSASSVCYASALLVPDDFSGEFGDDWNRVNDNLAIHH